MCLINVKETLQNRLPRMIDMILDPVKPEMQLNPKIKDFFKFDNSKELKDIKILQYKNMGPITFPLAQ